MVQHAPRHRLRPTLIDLLDIEAQRLRDERADPAVLRQRDRAIGKQLDQLPGREDRLVAWIRCRQQADPSLPGHLIARGMRLGTLGLCLLAGVMGALACSGALTYSGRYPVNVLGFLGVLILPQVMLILAWTLTMLPAGRLGAIPLIADLQAVLRSLSPGRLAMWLSKRWLPGAARSDQANAMLGVLKAVRQRYGEVAFLTLTRSAQLAGICFNLGAIAAFIALVVFSDLAFGWSTTLRWDAPRVHTLTSLIAWPWAWVWPQALPTEQLVTVSQYYRLEDQLGIMRSDPALLGGWWPFLLACLLTYGLLPRAVAMGIVALRLRRLLGRVTFDHPDHMAALLRLEPIVQTASTEPGQHPATARRPAAVAPLPRIKTRCRLLYWRADFDRQVLAKFLQHRLGCEIASTHAAPGQSAAEDQQALSQCVAPDDSSASSRPAPPAVVVVAKAWESPSRDLRQALSWLRTQLGPRPAITVCLVDQNEQGQPTAPSPGDTAIWQQKLREMGDAQLFVAAYQAVGNAAESADA